VVGASAVAGQHIGPLADHPHFEDIAVVGEGGRVEGGRGGGECLHIVDRQLATGRVDLADVGVASAIVGDRVGEGAVGPLVDEGGRHLPDDIVAG
jgi:hypothetical protein